METAQRLVSMRRTGVSFVIPVYNGEASLERVLTAILAQDDGRPMEIITVDDGSRDGSRAILERFADETGVIVVEGGGRGAAAAVNTGIRRASHPIVCQVDQDVILHSGWLTCLMAELEDPRVGAAQGYYVAPERGTIWSRVMGLDLEQRYHQTQGRTRIDHVCTGNTAYRTRALLDAGLLDETLGYGYDNDISYRLVRAGYRLTICYEATSTHEWRDNLIGYVRQQYGFGYGRLDLVAKHRNRYRGDAVSPVGMMLHAPLMTLAVTGFLMAGALALLSRPAALWTAWLSAGIIGALAIERLIAGVRATIKFRDPAGLLFAPVHIIRDLAWTAAVYVWGARRILRRSSHHHHSMHPRPSRDVLRAGD